MDPTISSLTTPTPRQKISSLLSQQKITLHDVDNLTPPERGQLQQTINKTLAEVKGADRDIFLNKIDALLPPDTKNDVWEHNHTVISATISNFMQKHGIMPTKQAVAEETGFSRQTVAKHFKEYNAHPEFMAQAEQFKFMSHNVLANVFKYASNGDMRAARLYFEMVGALNKQPAGTVVNAQNNYIQINNTILSQENLKQLTAEQLNQIENIVKNEGYKVVS
jgi:hypothetical protein